MVAWWCSIGAFKSLDVKKNTEPFLEIHRLMAFGVALHAEEHGLHTRT